ncbi:hypothetical protein B0H63DRAFT_206181 [Podospora didyma]|uniref:Secreted protein n=1 Tax=Podospora didyma TaxID=330526 RepID=A0AAE0NHC3_9PEZI|nr:hypothetical protein B0H63DRAFT_206181 [Podospora didyma]
MAYLPVFLLSLLACSSSVKAWSRPGCTTPSLRALCNQEAVTRLFSGDRWKQMVKEIHRIYIAGPFCRFLSQLRVNQCSPDSSPDSQLSPVLVTVFLFFRIHFF